MLEAYPNPVALRRVVALRSFVVIVGLALLAGCLPRGHYPPGPPEPTNLAATANNAGVVLVWTASTGATSYHLKRATVSGGPYSQIAAPSTNTYTDSAVTNGTTYYYVVSAVDTAGESANSPQASATPTIPAPAAPTNLTATPDNMLVALTWTGSANATGYNVKRATVSGGPYTQIATSTTASYTDSSVTNGTAYYYVVSAVNSAGESPNSTEASATPAVPTIPAAPTNLTATAGDMQVSLGWTASTGATSYHLKRSTTNGGPYTQIAAPTSTNYVDLSLTDGTNYYYVVSALNSAGESPDSAQVVGVPSVLNPPPTTFGTWVDVTPASIDLTNTLCGNVGAQTMEVDLTHPSNLYTQFSCQGVWRSTDYGATWTGPINTGTNAALVSDCVGGITVAPSGAASAPSIFEGCIRGNGLGFWKSVDGGVNWVRYNVAPGGTRQDYYPPALDPYDPSHLIMTGHEHDSIVESADGGQTWTAVPLNNGMLQGARTGFIFFINTGTAATTRGTWLWIGEQSGGTVGTWRTTDGGADWVQVDKNEHLLGSAQIYQPDTSGVYYMAGAYSVYGFGVLRSADYGQTWTHEGTLGTTQNLVFGSSKNVYSMGLGNNNPLFEVAAQPGTGQWVTPGTPPGLNGAIRVKVTNNGANNVLVGAMGLSGVWRYVEP